MMPYLFDLLYHPTSYPYNHYKCKQIETVPDYEIVVNF